MVAFRTAPHQDDCLAHVHLRGQVSSKIGVIESLLAKCDKLVIGGGMVFTFLKARGLNVGRSFCEPIQRKIPFHPCWM